MRDVARVLVTGFCAVPGPDRAGVQLRHVVRALAREHTVEVLAVRAGEQPYVERRGGVRTLRVPATADGTLRGAGAAYQRALARQLEGADYDVVHCRDAWAVTPVLAARARQGFAVIYDLTRSPLGHDAGDVDLGDDLARDEQLALAEADLVLVPGEAGHRYAAARGGGARCFVAPSGVDVDRFDWDDPPETGPPRVVIVGDIDRGRGVRTVIDAAAQLARELGAAAPRWVLAGAMRTETETRWQRAVADAGGPALAALFERPGEVAHALVPRLLATATVCVAPGGGDPAVHPAAACPTKVLEYLACRRAVVAPRRDAVAGILEHGRDGLLFHPDDAVDLARQVRRLLDEPALRQRLAEAGYQRVRQGPTASAARRAIRAAYADLAERFAERFAARAHTLLGDGGAFDDDGDEHTQFDEVAGLTTDVAFEESVSAPVAVDHRVEMRVAAAPVGDDTSERGPIESKDGWRVSRTRARAASDGALIAGEIGPRRDPDERAAPDLEFEAAGVLLRGGSRRATDPPPPTEPPDPTLR